MSIILLVKDHYKSLYRKVNKSQNISFLGDFFFKKNIKPLYETAMKTLKEIIFYFMIFLRTPNI